MIKTIVPAIMFVLFSLAGQCQGDGELRGRVDSVLAATRSQSYDAMFAYTYPRLFTLVKKEDLIAAIKAFYETDEFTMTLDSVNLKKIHPVFSMNNVQYARVDHTLRMTMNMKEEIEKEDAAPLITYLESIFTGGNIYYDEKKEAIVIGVVASLIAIKEKPTDLWTFMNYKEDDAMITQLLPAEVVEKLKSYK